MTIDLSTLEQQASFVVVWWLTLGNFLPICQAVLEGCATESA
jgi:hypothetical protein